MHYCLKSTKTNWCKIQCLNKSVNLMAEYLRTTDFSRFFPYIFKIKFLT